MNNGYRSRVDTVAQPQWKKVNVPSVTAPPSVLSARNLTFEDEIRYIRRRPRKMEGNIKRLKANKWMLKVYRQ